MYFVNAGARRGQFLILIDLNKDTKTYSVLGLPKIADVNDSTKEKSNIKLSSEALYITENDIKAGIDHKILEFVRRLPRWYFKDCKNEFQYQINIK